MAISCVYLHIFGVKQFNMKQVKHIAMLLILAFMLQNVNGFFSGEIPTGLIRAVSNGDCSEMSKYFNKTLLVEILENENTYSSTQAEQVLKTFYNQKNVLKVKILYEGGMGESKYMISRLITSKGIFRLSILIKSQLIVQLNIVKENGN
jgi:hypothetical protein